MFVVRLRDGRTLKENEVDWKEIPKKDITSLQLYKHGKIYTVSADGCNVDFIQLKRNLMDILAGTNDVTERVIGFFVDDIAIKMVVDEQNGNVKLTVQKKIDGKWKKL